MEDSIEVLILLRVEYINGIESTHTERNQSNILTNLHKRVCESASVWYDIEECTKLACRNGTLLRNITSWNFYICPRVLELCNAKFFIIELLQGCLIYLSHTNWILLFATVSLCKRFYPSVKESRCKTREHDVICLCESLHVLYSPFVVSRSTFLSSTNQLVNMLSCIIGKGNVIIELREIPNNLTC